MDKPSSYLGFLKFGKYLKRGNVRQMFYLTLARSGGGGVLMQPPMSFSELDATPFGESC